MTAWELAMPDGAFHEVKGRSIGLGASIADLPDTQDHMASSGMPHLPPRRNIRLRKATGDNCAGRARGSRKRQALPLRLREDSPGDVSLDASILALPADLLVHVFSKLDLKAHRFVLPLVCKQWSELLARPLALWAHLDIDFGEEAHCHAAPPRPVPSLPADGSGAPSRQGHQPCGTVRQDSIVRWLRPRSAAVHSLRLRGSAEQDGALVPNLSADVMMQRAAAMMDPPPRIHDFAAFGLAGILSTVTFTLEEFVVERCADLITTAAFRAMGGCKNLKVLSLKGIRSALGCADFEAIAALRQLEELVLDCDQPPEPAPGAEEIKWGLPEFPQGMLHLVNMTHLTLSCHYGITELPPGITSLHRLEVLNLDFCTLSALPPVLGQLTALTTLDVEGNLYLGDSFRGASSPAGAGMGVPGQGGAAVAAQLPPPPFPLDLAGLQSLRYLNLNSCGLTAIPAVLSALGSLETLDLEDNDLNAFLPGWALGPGTLGHLSRLQCLNLAQCKLTAVPAAVERLAGLRILDLTNNRITNAGLPMGLARLPHLKAIGLKRNALAQVPRLLGYARSLQEIYLEDNADLQVSSSLDFLVDLPHLRSVMMGKQAGTWSPRSMLHMADFAAKLALRHPSKNVLRISCPGHTAAPFDDEY